MPVRTKLGYPIISNLNQQPEIQKIDYIKKLLSYKVILNIVKNIHLRNPFSNKFLLYILSSV